MCALRRCASGSDVHTTWRGRTGLHGTGLARSRVLQPARCTRFPVGIVKEVMKSVLKQKLSGTSYNTEVTKEIAEIIRNKLKGASAACRARAGRAWHRLPGTAAAARARACTVQVHGPGGDWGAEGGRRAVRAPTRLVRFAPHADTNGECAEWGVDASGTATPTTTRQKRL